MKLKKKIKAVAKKKDFTDEMLEASFKEYALKMNEDVSKALSVAFNEEGDPDPKSLQKILARFPSAFAFLTTQHALIKDAWNEARAKCEKEESKYYTETAKDFGTKAKITDIKMSMNDEYGDILKPMRDRVAYLESKVDLARHMLQVFQTSCNALQSLGKLLTAEESFNRRAL